MPFRPDERYVNLVKETGIAPGEVCNAVTDEDWLGLFRAFLDGSTHHELVDYAEVVAQLQFAGERPETVWNTIRVPWGHDAQVAFAEYKTTSDAEMLESAMMNDVASSLAEVYRDEFLPFIRDVHNGAFDGGEPKELHDEVDRLNDEPAVRVRDSGDGDFLHEAEMQELLHDLTNPDIDFPSDDQITELLLDLAAFIDRATDKHFLNYLHPDDYEANEDELTDLFEDIEDFNRSRDRDRSIEVLRDRLGLSARDLNQLLHDLEFHYSEQIDSHLDERVTELSHRDRQQLRRRPGVGAGREDRDRQISGLQTADLGEIRPPAVTADDWNAGWVAQMNYAHIKAAEGGTKLAVVVNGEYALIGDQWNGDDENMRLYRIALTSAWQGQEGYPAQGLTEIGTALVEKGSGPFTPGRLVVSGIDSSRNREGITATVAVESKKKVVFED